MLPVTLRNLQPRDLHDIDGIRSWLTEYRDGRTLRQIEALFTRPNRLAYVAEVQVTQPTATGYGRLAGYLVADITPERLKIVELAVDEPLQRRRVAWRLVELAVRRHGGGRLLQAKVRERNIEAQLFLRDGLGLRWTHTDRLQFTEPLEDAYVFRGELAASDRLAA